MRQNALEPGRNFAPASASRILITPIIFISTVFEAFRTFRLVNDSVVHYPRMKKRRKMKCRGISWKFSDRFCQVSARRSKQIKTNILRKDIVDTAEYGRFRAFCCHRASSNGPFSTVSTQREGGKSDSPANPCRLVSAVIRKNFRTIAVRFLFKCKDPGQQYFLQPIHRIARVATP